MKRSPLKAKPRSKGNRYEAHLIEACGVLWPSMRRNFASGGQGGSDFTGTPGYAVEAKKRERLNIWAALEQVEASAAATETPLVIFACNRSRDYVALPLQDLKPLVDSGSLDWWLERSIWSTTERLRIWDRLKEAETTGMQFVLFNRNAFDWYAALPLDDFIPLVQAAQM